MFQYILKLMFNIIFHFCESYASTAGWVVGTFLAKMWGPFLHQGMKTYRNELARFLPEVIVHLRACNDMMLTLMENSYNDHEDVCSNQRRRHHHDCYTDNDECEHSDHD